MKYIIPYVFVLLLIVSCGKEALSVNPEFQGNWEGQDTVSNTYYSIEIGENSRASYASWDGSKSKSSSGVARINGSKLKIGMKSFSINTEPHMDTLTYQYTMVIEGIVYNRY